MCNGIRTYIQTHIHTYLQSPDIQQEVSSSQIHTDSRGFSGQYSKVWVGLPSWRFIRSHGHWLCSAHWQLPSQFLILLPLLIASSKPQRLLGAGGWIKSCTGQEWCLRFGAVLRQFFLKDNWHCGLWFCWRGHWSLTEGVSCAFEWVSRGLAHWGGIFEVQLRREVGFTFLGTWWNNKSFLTSTASTYLCLSEGVVLRDCLPTQLVEQAWGECIGAAHTTHYVKFMCTISASRVGEMVEKG